MARIRVAGLLVLLGATACASAQGDETPSADPAFIEIVDRQLEEARNGGATPEQIDILERARAEGRMSYALEKEALTAFFSCLDDAGATHEDHTVAAGREYPNVDFSVVASDPNAYDACFIPHADFVDTVYQLQPAAVDEVTTLIQRGSERIIACLREAGYAIADDPTYDELRSTAYFAYMGYYPDDLGAPEPAGFVPVDCLGAAGLDPADYHAGPG